MIARLQLSDLHLGDPRSTLSNPDIADRVTDHLAELSGGEVKKLVLAGDVHEECVPGDPARLLEGVAQSVYEASRSFFGSFFKKIRVGELVWVPGNHDLSAWHWACQQAKLPTITSYEGESVDASAWPWSVFYPGMTAAFTVAYPLYWDRAPGPDWPVLLTTHGHLHDPLVLGWDPPAKYALLRALGCERPDVPAEASGTRSLHEVAEKTLGFCLALWKRYSKIDYAYSNYVMRRLEHPQSCYWQLHLMSGGHYNVSGDANRELDVPPPGEGYAANLPWLLEVLLLDPRLPSPVGSLRRDQREETFVRRSCLTFGHDHLGTTREMVSCGVPFAVADSGGWTCEFDGHLPHTHVLAWERESDVVPKVYFILARTKGKVL